MKAKTHQWKRVLIKDICESIIDCVNKTAPTVEGPTPYKMIRTTNVKTGCIDLTNVRYVTKETYDKWTRRAVPRKGDVILTREAPLGEVGMLRVNDTIFLGQRLVQYRADPEKLDNRFLLYSFQAYDLQAQIKSFGSGATVEHMRVPDAEKLTILLPDIQIQKKIASILSTYDDLIENNTRRIEILEQMAKLVYEEWFVKFRFPGHENVKMVPSDLGEIPEGWKVEKLGSAVELAYGKSLTAKDRTGGSFPVYGSAGVVGAHHEYMVNGPGIIVGRKGNVGSVFWSNENFFPIDTVFYVKTNIPLHYVYFNLKNQNFINNDAAVPGLNRNQASSLPFLIPNDNILIEFEKNIDSIFKEIDILSRKNQNLRKTRDLLLPKLISGEIDISDLDIRIRNEFQES